MTFPHNICRSTISLRIPSGENIVKFEIVLRNIPDKRLVCKAQSQQRSAIIELFFDARSALRLKISGIAPSHAIVVAEKNIGPFRTSSYYICNYILRSKRRRREPADGSSRCLPLKLANGFPEAIACSLFCPLPSSRVEREADRGAVFAARGL